MTQHPSALFWSRLCLAASVIFISVQLGWQWLNGGIGSHHLLADPQMPALSNGWGLILLPLLGFLTARRLQQVAHISPLLWALAGSLACGGLLSALFVSGLVDLILPVLGFLLLLAIWLPLYRPEYLLGFVAGFSLAVGSVLPLLPATPLVLMSLLALGLKTVWRRRQTARPA